MAWADKLYFPIHHVGSRVHVCHLPGNWGKDAEEGKPAEEVCCSGQWSAGKIWVLAFMQILL